MGALIKMKKETKKILIIAGGIAGAVIVAFALLLIVLSVFIISSIESNVQVDTTEDTQLEVVPSADTGQEQEPQPITNTPVVNKDTSKVTYIVDGDTLDVGKDRIRLICIDTPERGEYYYNEAKEYLKDLTLNENVILEKDISETDRYGRLLRYIYLEDGTFVNEEMVKKGYAKAYPYSPDTSLCPIIESAESRAKSNDLGIWATQETTQTITTPTPSASCGGDSYNCGDFSTCNEVMDVFNACSSDVNKLDRDGDGVPCESLCG